MILPVHVHDVNAICTKDQVYNLFSFLPSKQSYRANGLDIPNLHNSFIYYLTQFSK